MKPTPTTTAPPAAALALVAHVMAGLEARASLRSRHRSGDDERGASIAEVLAYTALSVAALVALFALFNALGADVIQQVRQRLGLGG